MKVLVAVAIGISILGLLTSIGFILLYTCNKKVQRWVSTEIFSPLKKGLKRARKLFSLRREPSIVTKAPYLLESRLFVPECQACIVQPPIRVERSASFGSQYLADEITGSPTLERRGSMSDSTWKSFKRIDTAKFQLSEYVGMLNFSIRYQQDRSLLSVTLVKVEGLPPRKPPDELVDPFVEVQLIPSMSRPLNSEVHQQTSSPLFSQLFEIELQPYEVRTQRLRFRVIDFNPQLNHTLIGTVEWQLTSVDPEVLRAGKEFFLWKKIDKPHETSPLKNRSLQFAKEMVLDRSALLLDLSLAFLSSFDRLVVTINQVRNLPIVDATGRVCKHHFQVTHLLRGKPIRKQKTPSVRNDPNPVFNKVFMFESSSKEIRDSGILIHLVRDGDIKQRRRKVGSVFIGKLAAGPELEHWVDILDAPGETVTRWHRFAPVTSFKHPSKGTML